MGRCLYKLILPLAGMMLAGCASSPWSPWWTKHEEPSKAAATPAPVTPPAASSASAAAGPAQDKTVQEVMAELHQIGAIDPAAEEKLMADLLQTDRNLWPLMLQQFRAAAAYRRRAEEREIAERAAPAAQDRLAAGSATDRGSRQADPARTASTRESLLLADSLPPGTLPGSQASLVSDGSAALRATDISATPLQRVQPPPSSQQPAAGQAVAGPPIGGQAAAGGQKPVAGNPAPQAKTGVVPATYLAPVGPATPTSNGGDWQAQLATAIQTIEAKTKDSSKGQGDVALEARLRMLYLLAGRRDDAMQPISSASPAAQDYWSKQVFGLATWLDAERTPDVARRAAETKRILSEAVARLGETASLAVRNLAFCKAVQGYGSIQPFEKAEFSPDQEVILYAEVDNFSSVPTPKGFRTSLKADYQIFDSRGQRIAEHDSAPIEQVCQSIRHDYFIGYPLRLPKRIYPGRHTVQLTVEDTLNHKVGQSKLDFVVKVEE
jgi:hypothetical protein